MKVWPIDPLVPRNLRLEVPEKLTCVAFDGGLRVTRQSPLDGGDIAKLRGKPYSSSYRSSPERVGAHRVSDPGDGNNA